MTKQQLSKFFEALAKNKMNFMTLSKEDAQWVIKNTVVAIDMWVKAIKNRPKDNCEIRGNKNVKAKWQIFYKKFFGINCDFSSLRIPERPEGKYRLLVVADITIKDLYAKCNEFFPCWRWAENNSDKIVTENERSAKAGPYAIWVKDSVEADDDLKNLSANDIKAGNVHTHIALL